MFLALKKWYQSLGSEQWPRLEWKVAHAVSNDSDTTTNMVSTVTIFALSMVCLFVQYTCGSWVRLLEYWSPIRLGVILYYLRSLL